MKIQDVQKGDYVTFRFRGNSATVQTTDDAGTFNESVGLWLDDADKGKPFVAHQNTENNLYSLQMYEDIEETLHESNGTEVYLYEKYLTLYEQEDEQEPEEELAKPRLSDKQEFKIVGHIDLDKIPTKTRPEKLSDEEKKARDERNTSLGINGYMPNDMEAVVVTKQFKGDTAPRVGIAICKDSSHFYVAYNLYTTEKSDYITIMDEHPDKLEAGLFPKGTNLKAITEHMCIERMVAKAMLETYEKDINLYKALEQQRKEEEERLRKEEEEKKKKEEEASRAQALIDDTTPDVPESLLYNIYGITPQTIDYPFLENVSFQAKLAALNIYYTTTQLRPILYALSRSYLQQANVAYVNNPMSWSSIKEYTQISGCFHYASGSGRGITICYDRLDDALFISILNNEHLTHAMRLKYISENPDEPAKPEDFRVVTSFTNVSAQDKNGILSRLLGIITLENSCKMRIYNNFGTCNSMEKKEAREEAVRKWQEPDGNAKYVRRTVDTMPMKPFELKTEESTPTETEIKVTEVQPYMQTKYIRVEGKAELQPVRRPVSGYKKIYSSNTAE